MIAHRSKYFFITSILLVLIIQTNSRANIFNGLKLFGKKNSISKYRLIPYANCENQELYIKKLYNFNTTLCNKLKLKSPEINIFETKNQNNEYNAFATYLYYTKPNMEYRPIVAFGNLLVERWRNGWLTDQEIEAIFAHELSHLKCNHLIKSGVLNLALNGPFLINRIFVPTPSPKELTKNAFSRKLEKEADLKAIKLLDDPMALFTALVKLQCLNLKHPKTKEAFAIQYNITVNDLIKERKSLMSPLIEILSTHPLTSKRMAYIKKQAAAH